MISFRSTSLAFVWLPLFAACAAPPLPPAPAPSRANGTPVAAVTPPSPPSPPPATSGEPARVAVPIDVPSSACTIDVAAASGSNAVFGIAHVYVGAARIAHARTLGALRRVRLVFREEKPGVVFVAIDGDVVSIVGGVPLQVGTTDDLVLYPRTRVLRDGWLDYDRLSIARIGKSTLGPTTELDPSVVPASTTTFDVPCTELTPFDGSRPEPAFTHELRGKAIALEDEQGKKLATVAAETPIPPAPGQTKGRTEGKPVAVLAQKGQRTKIRFEAGRWLHAEGWVASRSVKAASWGGLGYGTGTGRMPKLDELTCERDVPLWADVQGTTFAVGTLHAHRTVSGKLDDKNDFRVDLGSGARVFGSVQPKKGEPVDPYVPRHELSACSDPHAPKTEPAHE